MWLWLRALVYMLIVGGGWLILLPAFILYVEDSWLHFRSHIYIFPGSGLILSGTLLALYAGYYLIRHGKGTPLPLDPTSQLVTTGPYRFVQNPQAIAMILMVTGEVLAIESNWLWLMLPLTIIYLEGIVAPWEKRQMTKQFGALYLDYVARVRKWIPRR